MLKSFQAAAPKPGKRQKVAPEDESDESGGSEEDDDDFSTHDSADEADFLAEDTDVEPDNMMFDASNLAKQVYTPPPSHLNPAQH